MSKSKGKLKRPKAESAKIPPTAEQIDCACYKGSAEHKAVAWWGGLPEAYIDDAGVARRPGKALTTICHLTSDTERRTATEWVRAALRAGQYAFKASDDIYPKHLWYRADGQVWFGFVINTTLGQYKGWPISEEERRAKFG